MIKTFIFDIFVLIQPGWIPTVVNLQLNCNCGHSDKGLSDITLGQQTEKKNFWFYIHFERIIKRGFFFSRTFLGDLEISLQWVFLRTSCDRDWHGSDGSKLFLVAYEFFRSSTASVDLLVIFGVSALVDVFTVLGAVWSACGRGPVGWWSIGYQQDTSELAILENEFPWISKWCWYLSSSALCPLGFNTLMP